MIDPVALLGHPEFRGFLDPQPMARTPHTLDIAIWSRRPLPLQ